MWVVGCYFLSLYIVIFEHILMHHKSYLFDLCSAGISIVQFIQRPNRHKTREHTNNTTAVVESEGSIIHNIKLTLS